MLLPRLCLFIVGIALLAARTRAALVLVPWKSSTSCPSTTADLAAQLISMQNTVTPATPITYGLVGPATGVCYLSRVSSSTGVWTRGDCAGATVALTQYNSQAGCVALNATDAVLNVSVAVGANQCTYVSQLRALAFAACGDSNTTSLAKPAMLPAGVVTLTAPMDAYGMLLYNNASLSCAPEKNAFVGGGAAGEATFVAAGGRLSKCMQYETWASADCMADGSGAYQMCMSSWAVTCNNPYGCLSEHNVETPFDALQCQPIYSGLRVLASWCTYHVERSAAVSAHAISVLALALVGVASALLV